MVEENTELPPTTENITDQIRSAYTRNRAARNRYEDSSLYSLDRQQKYIQEQAEPIAEQEAHAVANNQKSLFDEVVEFVQHGALGVAKAAEETGQVFGLRDNAFNIPEPDELGDHIARGIGQFSTWFIPATGIFKFGLKMAKLFQNSGRLTKAGQIVAGAAGGAVSDVLGFDPKDPNAANFALSIGVISKDSKVGAAVKEFLAQKDADSETIARLKLLFLVLFQVL